MDRICPEKRSHNMSRIRSVNTRPELTVRRLIHSMGYRYRLQPYPALPVNADLIFPGRRKVIFVHGCFWHQHEGCKGGHIPKSRVEYWGPKLERNRARDCRKELTLRELGWSFLVVWECELGNLPILTKAVRSFLDS